METVRFDDSLPRLVDVIGSTLGDEALRAGTILRDAVGCLAFFAAAPLDEETVSDLSTKLRDALGAYARPDRVVAGADDYGAAAVRADPAALVVLVGERHVRLVDKRLVGADWLHAPSPPARPPPRLVFASLKGGVGRSTALAVVAGHLASRGRRVLAVDLDMEAPGLGSLLLSVETLPEFGVIDALVENGLSGLDEAFFADLVGPSELAAMGGRIDVVPALGRRSLKNPADVLAKIARAYAEDVRSDGSVASILDQVRAIIDHLAEPTRYDAVLVDARAGLHETTASAVLGLGAEVLLFGLDEPQTFQGYAVLLAHLARFAPPGVTAPEWLERLTMVQGKAPADAEERVDFAQRCRDLFANAGLGPKAPSAANTVTLPAGPFKDVPWDDSLSDEEVLPPEGSLREPLSVLYDAQFQRFDPLRQRDLLSEGIYRATFGDVLERVDTILKSAEKRS
ncbi:KGGVGR-motif variant AAA ATPase [Sorangium sp. So ce1389]|uniref:KGGVGR-motif variant AAA ATPase n=1 Tax=Sorangium sp. So ce1389 TaxID=3133336 RepID=UPI003F62F309